MELFVTKNRQWLETVVDCCYIKLCLKWAISEKKKGGCWGYGVSRGIEEIGSWFSRGYLKTTQLRKNYVNFPGVLVLGLKISEGCNKILWTLSGWSLILSGISRVKLSYLSSLARSPQSYYLQELQNLWFYKFSSSYQLQANLVLELI